MTRAVIFDLDETLYPERHFILSGFAEVSRDVERRFGVPAADAFALLRRTLDQGELRAVAFQVLCARFGLPMATVGELVRLIRSHEPQLRLPRQSAAVLHTLRRDWKVGILTNGSPYTQARKIEALGLTDKVDAIVFASATGAEKPDALPFNTILDRLGVPAETAVLVGDDPLSDIVGARRVGMKTIRIRSGRLAHVPARVGSEADAVLGSLSLVPTVAASLLREAQRRVA